MDIEPVGAQLNEFAKAAAAVGSVVMLELPLTPSEFDAIAHVVWRTASAAAAGD